MTYPRTLNGVCIGVLSGDRVIFQGPISKDLGYPIQKVLHLAGIVTPKVDLNRGGDEPFGYASREFLRSRLVGKIIPFTIENKVAEIDIGYVTYEGEDITIQLLELGLAKVRGDKIKTKNADLYYDAEDQAKHDKVGLWSMTPNKQPGYQRNLTQKTVKQIGEQLAGKTVVGVVDEVQPSKFTVYIPEKGYLFELTSPQLQVVVLSEKTQGGESKNNAKQIRSLMESKVLHREVNVHVKGLAGADALAGYITHEGNDSRKIMLKFGYAKLSKDVINILDMEEFRQLKSVAQQAANAGRGLWKDKDHHPSKTQNLNQKEFVGKAMQVFSGDSLKVLNLQTNEVIRIYLANVKAPAQGKPYSWEAKEALRKRVIGKKVRVDIEFSKNITVRKNELDKGEDRNFIFATVFQSGKNVGALLLQDGLVNIQVPRVQDQFTKYFEQLKIADQQGSKKKKGVHGQSIRVPVFNDVTVAGKDAKFRVDVAKAKTIYSFLKDEKKLTGVVEFVLNGSRLKLRMHQQSCYLVFLIEGVRCLPNDPEFKKWSQAALDYSREALLQRDVEIQLTKLDKKGVFFGSLFVDKKNYALQLLDKGLAFQFGRGFPSYEDAQSAARKNKIGMWSEPINLASLKGQDEKNFKSVNFMKKLKIAQVISGKQFYLDASNSKKPEVPQKVEPVKQVKVGEVYAVKFTDDNVYYRGVIRKAQKNQKYFVHYVDYGNQELVTIDKIGHLDKPLKDLKSSLTRCGLYGLDNVTAEAADVLKDYLYVELEVEFKEECNGEYNVILRDSKECVNEVIIDEGFGECSCTDNPKWLEIEKKAKDNSRGLWSRNQDD